MTAPKILAFAGSAREDSFNKRALQIAVSGAREAGAEVTVADLRDFPLPIYDGDLEQREGTPENAVKFRELMLAHQGLLIASPEYNSSITGLLKNTIDWVTRDDGQPTLAAFDGKVAALLSASPGGLGGLRGLVHLRSILGNIKVLVLPDQVAISAAHEAFADDGSLKDKRKQGQVEALGRTLADTLARLHG